MSRSFLPLVISEPFPLILRVVFVVMKRESLPFSDWEETPLTSLRRIDRGVTKRLTRERPGNSLGHTGPCIPDNNLVLLLQGSPKVCGLLRRSLVGRISVNVVNGRSIRTPSMN